MVGAMQGHRSPQGNGPKRCKRLSGSPQDFCRRPVESTLVQTLHSASIPLVGARSRRWALEGLSAKSRRLAKRNLPDRREEIADHLRQRALIDHVGRVVSWKPSAGPLSLLSPGRRLIGDEHEED